MKKLSTRMVLAALVAISVAVVAYAQPEPPPMELNMLRPDFKVVASPEAGLSPMTASAVAISFNFDGTVSTDHQALFNAAAATWRSRIPFYASGVTGPAAIVIDVSEVPVDGPGGILGAAGPTDGFNTSGGFTLVCTGQMQFDEEDVADLVAAGTYDDVIEHEMGHVLGIGTMWNKGLQHLYVNGTGRYTGTNGLAAWKARFSGQTAATFVPVELGGAAGTANCHWNENNGGIGLVGITEIPSGIDMQFEMMTGWINAPLHYSYLTHRSLADLGYEPAPTSNPIHDLGFFMEHFGHSCVWPAAQAAQPESSALTRVEGKRAAASPAGIPNPATCGVDPCLVTCPFGDLVFQVIVRDAGNFPISGSKVELNFSDCSSFPVCETGIGYEVDPVGKIVWTLTDALGEANFWLRMGGLCPGPVRVSADGYFLGNRVLASPDQDGSLTVDDLDWPFLIFKLETSDPTGDLDCDGFVSGWPVVSVEPADLPLPSSTVRIRALWPTVLRGGPVRVDFELPGSDEVTLGLYDVVGRRVGGQGLGALVAGRHRVAWRLPEGLAPGVYVLGVTTGGGPSARTRLIVLHP